MRWWWRWFRYVTAGELLGFLVPAVVGASIRDARPFLAALLLVVAGIGEGAILGSIQAWVLREAVSGMPARQWVVATMAGAGLAWSVGAVLVASEGLQGWPVPAVVLTVAVGAPVMLGSLGVAQWWVLRSLIAGTGSWVWVTAAAWMLGLTAFALVSTPLWQPGQSTAAVVSIAVLAGLVMSSVMAGITGAWLVHLLNGRHCTAGGGGRRSVERGA